MYKQNSQKKHECDYCTKKFSTRSARNNHERKHTECYSSESSLSTADLDEDLQAEELPDISQDVNMRETKYKDMFIDVPFPHESLASKHFSKADEERSNNNKPERKGIVQEVDEDNYAPEQDETVQEEESAREIEESMRNMKESVREMEEGAQETEEEIGQDSDSSEEMDSNEVNEVQKTHDSDDFRLVLINGLTLYVYDKIFVIPE